MSGDPSIQKSTVLTLNTLSFSLSLSSFLTHIHLHSFAFFFSISAYLAIAKTVPR